MECCPDWPNLLNYFGLCENKYSNLLSPTFSERQRERSRLLIAVARPSVVCLSVVCNARAPYSGDCNFRHFKGIWYLGHPLTSTNNFTERVPGNPSSGRVKHKRGEPNVAILDLSKAISRKRCKIGGKLLLITNRTSHMSFRLVSKSVTLNDLERRIGGYFALFQRIW